MVEVKTYQAQIVKIVEETPDVKTYFLETKSAFQHLPGQFIMLSLHISPDGAEGTETKVVKRAYSIASAPSEKYIALTIRIYPEGELSSNIQRCSVGDLLTFTGPYGKFIFSDEKKPIVFIAGGTGIAPLRSMWNAVLSSEFSTPMQLLYSIRHAQDVIYARELQKLSAEQRMPFVVTVTRAEESYQGLTGRIDRAFIEKNVSNPQHCVYYICGAPGMVRDMKEALQALGVPSEAVHHEAW